jgi:hypothetical protein
MYGKEDKKVIKMKRFFSITLLKHEKYPESLKEFYETEVIYFIKFGCSNVTILRLWNKKSMEKVVSKLQKLKKL